MPIPKVAQWRNDTSRIFGTRNNPLILDIDILLREYETDGKTDVQKQKILILMLYICTEWLVNKSKSNWRRPYVKQLIAAIETELRTQTMTQATQVRLEKRPGVTMKSDPIELLQPRDISGKLGLSGTSQFQRLAAGDAKGFVAGFGGRNGLTGHLEKLQGIMPNDYVDELRILAAGNAAGLLKKDLEYLTKSERLKYQLFDYGDFFSLFRHTEPYSTDEGTYDIFVMDENELLYVSGNKGSGKFHHSSFLSGGRVLCAGTIRLKSGKIINIGNFSGHYQPDLQALLRCVIKLRDRYGCDLKKIKVEGTTTGSNSITWKSAEDFLTSRGVKQATQSTVTQDVKGATI